MRQKSKAIISFILSLILCFSFFPSTVYAAEYKPTDVRCIFSYGSLENPTRFVKYDGSIPCSFNEGTIDEIGYLTVNIYCNIKCNAGDVINFDLINTYQRYAYAFTCSDRANINCVDSDGRNFSIGGGSLTYTPYTFSYCDIVVPRDCTIDMITVSFEPQKVRYHNYSTSLSCGIGFSDCTITVESEQTGFFNSIKEFFQQLFDKLTSGLDNIGTWFSELGDKLSSFFSDLVSNIKEQFTNMIDNLKSFFSDVGDWFSEIGDRIGSFFTDLWDNITVKIEGITESISEWWQSVVDFFRSLFVPEDGFFDKYKEDWEAWARLHFALLYDVKDVFDGFFDAFNAAGTPDDYITIPEIKLPFLNNKTIVPETRFDLTDFIHSSDTIYYIYELFQIIVTCLGFFLIVKYCMATFSKIITGDDDTL